MRSSKHRVDDELHIFGVDLKKIFKRFNDEFHARSHEIWDQVIHIIRSIENPRRLWRTKLYFLEWLFS
jgi:hypothetical protein